MFETKTGILLIGGLGFFAFAFLANGALPMMMYQDMPVQTAEEVVNPRLLYHFQELSRRYPEPFEKAYGKPPAVDLNAPPSEQAEQQKKAEAFFREQAAAALRLGRQAYVGEGCWHCHSQFVRPVSNESLRFGPVSQTHEYQNELQRPVMFGTRRVGPDLSREGGRRSNDWHAVHFWQPQWVSPKSPMPEYPWLFEGGPDKPNRRGLALITYVQWLGSWLDEYPYYEELEEIEE